MNLWAGLRQVYFGTTESFPERELFPTRNRQSQRSPDDQFPHALSPGAPIATENSDPGLESDDDREIAALRSEIAELEQRAR
jgi:hypothetical protein